MIHFLVTKVESFFCSLLLKKVPTNVASKISLVAPQFFRYINTSLDKVNFVSFYARSRFVGSFYRDEEPRRTLVAGDEQPYQPHGKST